VVAATLYDSEFGILQLLQLLLPGPLVRLRDRAILAVMT
jgi:hypothetical protein